MTSNLKLFDVLFVEPRISNYKISKQPPITGEKLCKAMTTISEKYGCEYVFARKVDMGRMIVSLLHGNGKE